MTPAPDKLYHYSVPGKQTNILYEAVFTFAPGTGPSVMAKVRAVVKTGCGLPNFKLLTSPPTVADEVIVYTEGTDVRSVLVRSGDRVASMIVNTFPAGQTAEPWIDTVAQQMAIRLTAG